MNLHNRFRGSFTTKLWRHEWELMKKCNLLHCIYVQIRKLSPIPFFGAFSIKFRWFSLEFEIGTGTKIQKFEFSNVWRLKHYCLGFHLLLSIHPSPFTMPQVTLLPGIYSFIN